MNVDFITCIDDIVMESQINVYNSFYDYYHKMYMLTEYSNDVFTEYCSVFQEQLFLVSDTTTKKKKNVVSKIVKIIKELFTAVVRAVKRFISKHFGNKKGSIDKDTNIIITKNKLDDLISLTNKLLDIDITSEDVKYDNYKFDKFFEDVVCDKKTSEVKVEYIKNKLNDINKIMESINTRISLVDKCVDGITDNIHGSDRIDKLYKYCELLKDMLNEYINMIKNIDKALSTLDNPIQINNVKQYMDGPYCFKYNKDNMSIMSISSIDDIKEYRRSKHTAKLDENTEHQLFELAKTCRQTDDYIRYKIARDKLCDMLGFHKDVVFNPGTSSLYAIDHGELTIYVNPRRETSSILLKPGTELYHTSSKGGLTHLKPTFRALGYGMRISTCCDSMYPTSRVYFFLRNPGSRLTTSNDYKFSIGLKNNTDHVYKYTVKKPLRVKIDTEAESGTYRKAVFIETTEPIPVEDVTDQFRRTK